MKIYTQRKKEKILMGIFSGDTKVDRGSKNHLKDYQLDTHAGAYQNKEEARG